LPNPQAVWEFPTANRYAPPAPSNLYAPPPQQQNAQPNFNNNNYQQQQQQQQGAPGNNGGFMGTIQGMMGEIGDASMHESLSIVRALISLFFIGQGNQQYGQSQPQQQPQQQQFQPQQQQQDHGMSTGKKVLLGKFSPPPEIPVK
jgi:predicted lipid-binding transport protein (Tim44 family)